eukprot:CAMPEP_0117598694 /NCGR_PEP_ID=MMETSP0784-20121206/75542_1 /TAXON_ID=39447 /ORGANISM="" /LENGTH=93 /DNA_ID=CAMNT_0005401179 /DNA_START=191 /DNA_END=472 /DNA_ORIENTATION=+
MPTFIEVRANEDTCVASDQLFIRENKFGEMILDDLIFALKSYNNKCTTLMHEQLLSSSQVIYSDDFTLMNDDLDPLEIGDIQEFFQELQNVNR